jgi:bifunctional non-homologous end joining protein LigD
MGAMAESVITESLSESRQRGEAMPQSIAPMLGITAPLPRRSQGWAVEFKWDDGRAITYWDGRSLRIESRTLADVTFRYPELHDLGNRLDADAILDGEIIALDERGRLSFSKLQQRMHIEKPNSLQARFNIRVHYYIFDLLYFNGSSPVDRPYEQRREALAAMKIQHPFTRVPPSYRGGGQDILTVAREHGLEGVVCKRLGSFCLPGRRSPDWRKVRVVNSREGAYPLRPKHVCRRDRPQGRGVRRAAVRGGD